VLRLSVRPQVEGALRKAGIEFIEEAGGRGVMLRPPRQG
jgi:hypothetical protein